MTELTITGMHLYHNLALIEKGLNTEQGAPEWLKTFDHTHSYTDK
jgi:demethylmacrocin O-methyltransferase